MSHFFFIEDYQIASLEKLILRKNDGEYIVLASSNGFSDIAQYTDKFQDLKIIAVPSRKLDPKKELR